MMANTFENSSVQSTSSALPHLPVEYLEARWYAAYTNPRHERQVALQLDRTNIESFVPVYRSVRRWKDRRKELELPLFPGYVFVHIALRDRLRILQLPGVVHFVSFHGKPAPLPASDIEALRNGLSRSALAQPHPYLKIGRRVRVHSGPMAGMEGILIRRKDKFRVVLSIHLIQRSVAVEVDEAEIEAIR
ncbi:MAG TPA: UpxY family transcription antiterminator [Terriglobales bacterium]|nr:UpxY family transcription antiterminator [Terriglobales bacterium]